MKVYPINVEVATTRTYNSTPSTTPASYTESVTISLNTSMVLLPKVPMRKRFGTLVWAISPIDIPYLATNRLKQTANSFISRFRLEPKDPRRYRNGQLTEPIKPIVFYIDPATPKKVGALSKKRH